MTVEGASYYRNAPYRRLPTTLSLCDDNMSHMPITYTNRRSQTFYLHQGKTKIGRPNYFFSLKSSGPLADTIPEGYEVYENPNGQVFLRKKKPTTISDSEIRVVDEGMRKYSDIEYYKLDTKNNAIIVYLADQD